jgi:hypothetical protein
MTLATKNGSLIVKDGKIAERCGCCQCQTKWSEATAIEVEIETISDYRETVACKELSNQNTFSYATQQMCPEKYTGTFSLTKTGRAEVANLSGLPLYEQTWRYDFGNNTSFILKATDDWNRGPNSTWVNLSWSISLATLVSWKRFPNVQANPYPSAADLCNDASILQFVPLPPSVGFPGPNSIKYAASTQQKFLATTLNPPGPVELYEVKRFCLDGPQVTVATSLAFGQVSEVVTPATAYEIWRPSLMSDLQTSGRFNACDRFSLTNNCVQLLEQSPAGIYGSRKIGTFQVKSITFFF